MASRAHSEVVGPANTDARTAERHRVVVTRATLRRHGDEPCEAVLKDLSIYGCRVTADTPRAAGDRIWLRFTGGMPVAATVIWCDGGVMGCRFDAPVASRMVRALTLMG